MSLPKIVGIEQEYAIQVVGEPDVSAFEASCMLINGYARKIGLRRPGMRMLWDYAHETPYDDIRGRLFRKGPSQVVVSDEDNLKINAVLPNGARFYTDHAHPEYATAECRGALQVVACDKAGEIILQEAVAELRGLCPELKIRLFKNNSDHQGHSYGCHENYLMSAEAHETCIARDADPAVRLLIPFLVTRQVMSGAGKIGSEGKLTRGALYQVSQRADYIESLFGLETMYARPLINTRCEHHADGGRFRRLHLILGDANMCEMAAFLKIGSTQIVLQMMEEDFIQEDLSLKAPLEAIGLISKDFAAAVELKNGERMNAVQIQRRFLESARSFAGTPAAAQIPDYDRIVAYWADILDGLDRLRISREMDIESDPGGLAGKLDWVLKLWLLNRYRRSAHCGWQDPALQVLDLQYHRMDNPGGLFDRLQQDGPARRLIAQSDIQKYVSQPPEDTRAWFRGRCIQKYGPEIILLNWEVVGFDYGAVHRMIPLLNPLKGTRDQFENDFLHARSSSELIYRLEDKPSESTRRKNA